MRVFWEQGLELSCWRDSRIADGKVEEALERKSVFVVMGKFVINVVQVTSL